MLSALFYQVHVASLTLHLPDPHNPSRLSNFLGAWKQENELIRLSWRSNALHVPSISAACWPHFLVLRGRGFPAGFSEHIPGERGAGRGSGVRPSPGAAGRGPSSPGFLSGAPHFLMPGHPPRAHCGASSAHAPYFLSNFSHLEDKAT